MKALLFIPLLLLASCASDNDQLMNVAFDTRATNHDTQQSAAIQAQSTAIAAVGAFRCTDNMSASECALGQVAMGAVTAKEISSLEWKPFRGTRGTTGIDAQIEGLKTIAGGIPFVTVGVVSYKAIDQDKGSVTNTVGGDGTITNSYEEDHATVIGDSGVASNQPAQDNSSELLMPEAE